jgi:anthranilate/para-aminobenzoate synthase component I
VPVVREITLVPDVLRLARALAGEPGLAVLATSPRGALGADEARFSFIACDPVERAEAWVPPRGPDARGWAGHAAAPRWIGVVPYEAGRGHERAAWSRVPDARPAPWITRPVWLRYDAVARIDHASGRVVLEADDAEAAERLALRLSRAPATLARAVLRPAAREADEAHVERVREVLRLIARGDVYQVNLARCLEYELAGDPLDAFVRLFDASPTPYGFYGDFGTFAVSAASPELALEVRGVRMRTAPIKGTRPRGAHAAADASLAEELDADPKERAELTMAIDLHRNDLGRVAEIGSVRVQGRPRVLGGRTVWSRVATIAARRAGHVTLEQIVRAMIPSGSVTGAPKVRAMEVIASLEPFRRGLYTGAFGYVGRDGGLVLAMAIRTLEIDRASSPQRARFCTGGGIVAESDPARELEETRWKSAQLDAILSRG